MTIRMPNVLCDQHGVNGSCNFGKRWRSKMSSLHRCQQNAWTQCCSCCLLQPTVQNDILQFLCSNDYTVLLLSSNLYTESDSLSVTVLTVQCTDLSPDVSPFPEPVISVLGIVRAGPPALRFIEVDQDWIVVALSPSTENPVTFPFAIRIAILSDV